MNRNTYFSNELSLDEGKKLYRELLKANHPDIGGDAIITGKIIEAFDQFCGWKIRGAFDEAGDKATGTANASVFADILKEVMKMNITVEIIGFWIYVFNSYEVKDQLKEMGFFFSKKHKAWIFNGGEKLRRFSNYNTNQIRDRHGSEVLRQHKEPVRITG